MKNKEKMMTRILLVMVVAVMMLGTMGCSKKDDKIIGSAETVHEDGAVLGEGSRVFDFTVVHMNGDEVHLEIHTDKETVGEALMDLGVIAGEEGEYGMYVKTVNGETVSYEEDGKYWAFYINGEYGMSGVDTTTITEGDTYALKVE